MARGLYVQHPLSLEHDTGPHPENAERIRAIEATLQERGWLGMERAEAPAATREQLLRVHSPAHVEAIERFCESGGGLIDMDTVASPRSFEAALRAAGGAAWAAERLLAGEFGFAFCGLRPPGHHAESSRAMGFCLFNNLAVAVADSIAGGRAERVLVLDWDVHHGNGTAAIFAASDRVLYVSIHQSPLYPGTGAADDCGEGRGLGYTVNLPVPPGSGGELFGSLVERVAVPLVRRLRPELVAISAGFDAHRDDPLAECELTESDYAGMAASIGGAAAEVGAPLLICLEGGYDLRALSASVAATLAALGEGQDPPRVAPEPAEPYLRRVRERWPGL